MTEETINKFLLNRLNDVNTPDRVACYIVDGKLEICIPEPIIFDPITQKGKLKKVYAGGIKIDGSKLDKNIMMQLFEKLSIPQLTHKQLQEKSDKEMLEKYRVISKKTTKKFMKKATEEIQRYEIATNQ